MKHGTSAITTLNAMTDACIYVFIKHMHIENQFFKTNANVHKSDFFPLCINAIRVFLNLQSEAVVFAYRKFVEI